MRELLTDAIARRRVLTFRYDGLPRRVLPAAYGRSRDGQDVLHAYQVGGGSRRGDLPQWRNFHAARIEDLAVLDETFDGTPPGYAPGGTLYQVYAAL